MKADDELCFCFHVTWRKVINYIRRHDLKHASQVSECYGAGTGCGWCRRQITRLMDEVKSRPPESTDLDEWLLQRTPTSQSHAEGRAKYLEEKNTSSSPSLTPSSPTLTSPSPLLGERGPGGEGRADSDSPATPLSPDEPPLA